MYIVESGGFDIFVACPGCKLGDIYLQNIPMISYVSILPKRMQLPTDIYQVCGSTDEWGTGSVKDNESEVKVDTSPLWCNPLVAMQKIAAAKPANALHPTRETQVQLPPWPHCKQSTSVGTREGCSQGCHGARWRVRRNGDWPKIRQCHPPGVLDRSIQLPTREPVKRSDCV